ncbi:hypothetical protein [Neobacillus kokaensis]|uniref:DUF4365 domain-containing protein n=1 Tax=Neobacillus kokaensis TaxID=2759023 RepID=A0ABQ3N9R8_9BACI|nr:hypothetical protein [Neobacillus kokaensis]GHI00628.1 hypothetical protein AM1BK_41700 [Neobacillus kokaensis]
MSREADHTIKGFLYQFSKTLNVILSSTDKDEIQIEGIIEDIDLKNSNITNAIQCKYHESKVRYNLSDIYKPILQMLIHFLDNDTNNVKYVLYAHFPNEQVGINKITKLQIEEILSSSNFDYISKYISKIKPPKDQSIKDLLGKASKSSEDKTQIKRYYENTELEIIVDIDKFLKGHFIFEIGLSYEELIKETKKLLMDEGFSLEDVKDLFYPNGIQYIAELSILPEAEKRITSKNKLIGYLHENKKTAMSRWTSELLTRKELLKVRKNQLVPSLNVNSRLRYFIMNPDTIENFDDEFILFVKDYLEKYNSKIKLHTETPCFILKTDVNRLSEYHKRFVSRNIQIITGYIGDTFYFKEFNKEPKRIIKDNWVEFKAKISCNSDEVLTFINSKKCDDLYLIGEIDFSSLDTTDVNIEHLHVSNFRELKYLLSMVKEI